MMYFLLSASAAVFLLGLILWVKDCREAGFAGTPAEKKELSPAAASLLLNNYFTVRHVTAMTLSQVLNGNVRVEADPSGAVKYIEADVRKVIWKHEEQFLQFLLYRLGENGVFYMEDVETKTREPEGREEFYDFLERFKKEVEADLVEEGIVYRSRFSKIVLPAASLFLTAAGALLLFDHTASALMVWAGAAGLGVMAGKRKWLTEYGREKKEHIQHYREYLKNQKVTPESAEELAEDYIFSAAFGLENRLEETWPLRDASSVRIRQSEFPLYAAAPGTAAFLFLETDEAEKLDHTFLQVEDNGQSVSITGDNDGA